MFFFCNVTLNMWIELLCFSSCFFSLLSPLVFGSFHADRIKSDQITRFRIIWSIRLCRLVERMGNANCKSYVHPLDGAISSPFDDGSLLMSFVSASVPFGRQSGPPVNPNGFSKGIAKLGQTSWNHLSYT